MPVEEEVFSTRSVITVGARPGPERAWLLALLPSFPIVLLVLRVWFLARQDVETMALLLQSASPLGLASALLISLVWAGPALLLGIRVCYLLHRVSAPPGHSWLSRVGARTPAWTSVPAFGLALLSWQLRFLPLLLLALATIVRFESFTRPSSGSSSVRRMPSRPARFVFVVALAGAAGWWLASGVAVVRGGVNLEAEEGVVAAVAVDPTTAALLGVPLLLVPLLPGRLPARFAERLLPTAATVLVLVLPVFVGQLYLRAPVLPHAAITVAQPDGSERVEKVSLVAQSDTHLTVLDDSGVRFVKNGEIEDQVQCPAIPTPPTVALEVHRWQVEQEVLAWLAPTRVGLAMDARCLGRSVRGGPADPLAAVS